MGRYVLVVEDNPDYRIWLAIALRRAGYDPVVAADGAEALDMLEARGIPDLILCDLKMPTLSGPDFVRQLRRITTWASIPVVIVSGEDDIRQQAATLGAAGYLRKSTTSPAEALLAEVARHLH